MKREERLNVLFVEDSDEDLLLELKSLERGFRCIEYTCVRTVEEIEEELNSGNNYSIVISDFFLPGMNGLEVVKKINGMASDLPVIIVSGRLGEETAVDAMREGAHDCIKKDNLSRLLPAVERELKEHSIRREHIAVKKELQESSDRYQLLIEAIPLGVAEFHSNGTLLYANSSFFKTVGNSGKEGPASLHDFLGEKGEAIYTQMREIIQAEEPPKPYEIEILSEDKEKKELQLDWTYQKQTKNGEDIRIITVFTDITQKKYFDEFIRRTQKLESIGTLAGGIAHDFNNILMVIVGYTELAMERVGKERKLYRYLQEVYKSSLRARDLIQQILTFSRQNEGVLDKIQLGPIVKEVMKLLRSTLPSTIKISSKVKSKGYTYADPTQIHQILMNLCTNSFHAMKESGGVLVVDLSDVHIREEKPLRVASLSPGEYIKLEITDTGKGIKEEYLDKIFEPYFTTKDVDEGTGLGLSVVHGIIKNYRGALDVTTVDGKGTTFTLYFKEIKHSAEVSVSEGETKKEDLRGEGSILFVDDEEDLVEMVGEILEDLGYSVSSTSDSMKALEMFRQNPESFDCIITDQTMPKLTGFDLAKEIFSINPDLPIILCTGYSEIVTKEKAREAGIRGFLMKPIVRHDLGQEIKKVLDYSPE